MPQWFMQQEIITLPEIKLAGLMVRTQLTNELNPLTAKIAPTIAKYWASGAVGNNSTSNTFFKLCGTSYAVYTNYASNEYGEYDYFYGQEIIIDETATTDPVLPEAFALLNIPGNKYVKFTTHKGPMPFVVINAWQNIWRMSIQDLGGTRLYAADFEVYDMRASDPTNAVVDIYVSIS